MDYEKKYNHALEVVRELQKDWASTQNRAAREIELAFPELRESEDEKIRTSLYTFFQGMLEGNEDCYKVGGFVKFEGIDVKSILAWLEKQKEQKVISQEDFDTAKHEALWGEQNARDHCSVRDEFDLDGNLKQKPAEWSEEDEKNLGQVISGRYLPLGLREWFCGLPERFSSRPSWKPSEEQMEVLLNAEGLVRANNYNENAKILASLYEQLKKL